MLCNPVHARLDLETANKQVLSKEAEFSEHSRKTDKEFEKKKEILLMYCEYAGKRHSEVVANMEEAHFCEMEDMKEKMDRMRQEEVEKRQTDLKEEKILHQKIETLENLVTLKDIEIEKLKGELEWSVEKESKLANALARSSSELHIAKDEAGKWEYRAGEQLQQVQELERLRCVLTSQLHMMREALGPKQDALISVNQQLRDLEVESENTLHALSKKQQQIDVNNEMNHLLNTQVKELRKMLFNKEAVLKRAARLFQEYQHALQSAQFNKRKVTVNPRSQPSSNIEEIALSAKTISDQNQLSHQTSQTIEFTQGTTKRLKGVDETVEIFVRDDHMAKALQNLDLLFAAYNKDGSIIEDVDTITGKDSVMKEQQRHIELMHQSINVLKASVDLTHQVSSTKINHHVRDNRKLLEEINAMRHEMKLLAQDNQRMLSKIDGDERRYRARDGDFGSSVSISGNSRDPPSVGEIQSHKISNSADFFWKGSSSIASTIETSPKAIVQNSDFYDFDIIKDEASGVHSSPEKFSSDITYSAIDTSPSRDSLTTFSFTSEDADKFECDLQLPLKAASPTATKEKFDKMMTENLVEIRKILNDGKFAPNAEEVLTKHMKDTGTSRVMKTYLREPFADSAAGRDGKNHRTLSSKNVKTCDNDTSPPKKSGGLKNSPSKLNFSPTNAKNNSSPASLKFRDSCDSSDPLLAPIVQKSKLVLPELKTKYQF